MPLPNKLLKKTSSWSESSSNPGSNSKNPNDENLFPKSLANKDKFIYDPEHGGGRRRRNRKCPRIIDADDQIGQRKIREFEDDFESNLNLAENTRKEKFLSPGPFEIADNILEEPKPLQTSLIENIQHQNATGEAQILHWDQSFVEDFGLMNSITP